MDGKEIVRKEGRKGGWDERKVRRKAERKEQIKNTEREGRGNEERGRAREGKHKARMNERKKRSSLHLIAKHLLEFIIALCTNARGRYVGEIPFALLR